MIDDEVKAMSLKFLPLTDNLKLQKECLGMGSSQCPDKTEPKDFKESIELEGKASHRAELSYEICMYMAFD